MHQSDEAFLKRLLATFKVEAQEHIDALSSGLVDLEKTPLGDAQGALLETIFREAHSLKGAARSVNVTEIESICQALETILLNGEAVSFVRLGEVLGESRAGVSPAVLPVLVLNLAGKRIAFQVEEIRGEQEVLVKSLGPQLERVRNIAGATILGAGKVVPILHVPDLIKSAVRLSATPVRPAAAPPAVEDKKKSILVVEDSITARILLKSILETAGYDVETAVDGIDAFSKLAAGDFTLVVSDVDMPRMDDFDLTARIRHEKKFAGLPVVLVTVLESPEDRERGIDVGASAYIVKSSFDQSNLLEIVRRLI